MKKNIAGLFVSFPLVVFGVLMLLFAKTEPREGWHEAATLFVEEIWSPSSGITLMSLGLVFLTFTVIDWKKPERKKPVSPSALFYHISFSILKITVLVYAIMLLQYALGSYKVISMNYSYDDESMGTIHMVCITFIICFGIFALVTGLISRKARKNMNA